MYIPESFALITLLEDPDEEMELDGRRSWHNRGEEDIETLSLRRLLGNDWRFENEELVVHAIPCSARYFFPTGMCTLHSAVFHLVHQAIRKMCGSCLLCSFEFCIQEIYFKIWLRANFVIVF